MGFGVNLMRFPAVKETKNQLSFDKVRGKIIVEFIWPTVYIPKSVLYQGQCREGKTANNANWLQLASSRLAKVIGRRPHRILAGNQD